MKDHPAMIQNMMAFTKAYEENSDNIYRREARCLEVQFSYLMQPIRPYDLLAGRKGELPIGFWAQNSYGTVGYYCAQEDLRAMKKDPALSNDELKALDYLMEFWKGKTTDEKIYDVYTQEQKDLLTHGDFTKEPGIAFPLYRMSGAQMNPEKLLKRGITGLIDDVMAKRENSPDFYDAVKDTLLMLQSLFLRYRKDILAEKETCADARRAEELSMMAANLEHVAYYAPETLWQAIQLSYMFYLLSGTYNYGRMDEYLGSYFVHDIDNGVITEEFAYDLLTNLWDLIIERDNKFDGRIVLGGKDRKNLEDADRFAMAAMEVSRRTKDVLPQLTLRCYTGMKKNFMTKRWK